ncbi:MAG: hypothetical protein ACQGVK_02050 [Myxococcota bacterium]
MADLKLRPRFSVDVCCGASAVVAALEQRIEDADSDIEGRFDTARCVLRIPESRRYLWSPELDVTFDPLDGSAERPSGVRVRCLFTPRPSVWTVFAFLYGVLALLGLCGGIYGLTLLTLGHFSWLIVAPLVSGALIGLIYGATFIGQGLASTQMYELRRYLDEGLERAEAHARVTPRTPFDSAQL